MKACVFQKQEPVNIPQIETGVLTDVLAPALGLRDLRPAHALEPAQRPAARTRCPYNGKNVLVVGLGPAGYTLAHHLLNEGFGVVGIDGLKIEPLPAELTGERRRGRRSRSSDFDEIYAELDERVLRASAASASTASPSAGTRTSSRSSTSRSRGATSSAIYGGVRFGGTLTLDDAWALGFDHVAIAAGRRHADDHRHEEQPDPRHPQGERLPDGAAAHRAPTRTTRSRTCRCSLPAVVIGGGLTAIDTATELLAYYPVQVEKTLERYERARRRARRGRRAARVRRGGARDPRRVPARTAARSATSARARPRRAGARLRAASSRRGAASRSSTASGCSTRPPTA